MPNLLNDAIKEAYEYAPNDITYYDTLEFNHDDFIEPIRIINGYRPFTTSQGEFIPVLFEFSLPEVTSNVQGELTVKIGAIPLRYRLRIRSTIESQTKMTLTYRQYIIENTDPDVTYPIPLQIKTIIEKDIGLEIKAILSGLSTAIFPRRIMSVQELPGAIL